MKYQWGLISIKSLWELSLIRLSVGRRASGNNVSFFEWVFFQLEMKSKVFLLSKHSSLKLTSQKETQSAIILNKFTKRHKIDKILKFLKLETF